MITGLCRYRALLLSSAALASAGVGLAMAGPNGGTVVGGGATIQGQGSGSVTINQSSQNAIINWNTFNISKGETTTFNQPNSASTALNRVIGGQGPSFLDGTLTANGRVFIVNGDGILFGANSRINTAGFLATTSDIRNQDFMAGKYNFNIPGNPSASIVNLGKITATSGGFAALVAPGVRNSGIISAKLGTVSLAAGNAFTLDFYGDQLITLAVNDQIAGAVKDVQTGETLKSLVSNTGKLKANGGRVELTAAAARVVVDSVINNKGVIEANSIGNKNGMIVLGAATGASKPAGAPVQTVKLSGKLSAAGKKAGTKGGTVVVTGEDIQLVGATIDASGQAGGGKVLIGGDTGGGKVSPAAASIELAKLESFVIATATTVSVDAASTINASAVAEGNGGKVIVWSNKQTTFAGTILARGGAAGGNGGFIETSGHNTLAYTGMVDLGAPKGKLGTALLDPGSLNIDNSCPSANCVTVASIQGGLANGNFIVTTGTVGGDITVDSNVNLTWANASTLTLSAFGNIAFQAGAAISNTGAGNLVLRADNTGTGTGTVSFGSSNQIKFAGSTGTVSIFYNPADNPAGSVVNATSYTKSTDYSPYVLTNSSNQLTSYMLVNTVYDLQNIHNNLSGTYALGKDIKASVTAGWNNGAGFAPIGTVFTPFVGLLDGEGQTVDKLTIHSGAQLVGLFGQTNGTIRNLGLTNASVTTTGNSLYLGVLAGTNGGSIANSYTTGQAGNFGGAIPSHDVEGAYGGLVGLNVSAGKISHSYSTASVHVIGPSGTTSGGYVDGGGLVGQNRGSIASSHAEGVVTGQNASSTAGAYLGGLVGWNVTVTGTISQSYASGAVTGTGTFTFTGGLVGVLEGGSIAQSYASGSVSGTNDVGGLVGSNKGGAITQAYATGSATGGASSVVGGLVGTNFGTINQTFASGAVTGGGSGKAGGLVGVNNNSGGITASYWDAQTTGQQHSSGSLDSFGLTTAQAMTQSSYVGWSFGSDGAWFMIDGQTRPFLRSEWSSTITNSHQLQLVAMQPGASYTLANNVALGADLTNPSSMWSSAGFVPIGNGSSGGFTGTFDGKSNTIDGLTIAPTNASVNNIGLFGALFGSVSNLNLTNVSITANPNAGLPGQFVGTLAGQNFGSINGVSVIATGDFTNTLDGGKNAGVSAGGLVGQNVSTIAGSSAAVNVSLGDGTNCLNVASCAGGLNMAGGLAGTNNGTISSSFANGNVISGLNSLAGGLVGANNGAIASSHATGDVAIAGDPSPGANPNPSFAGGLVGQNGNGGNPSPAATITASYATGNVTGTGLSLGAGGLVGNNAIGSTITDSQASGNVTASTDGNAQTPSGAFVNAGGLVGYNQGTITSTTSLSSGLIGATPGTGPQSGTLASASSAASVAPGSICALNGAVSCASGAVTVGARGQAGGLVGNNDGTVVNVFATGAVTGAAGLPPGNANNNGDNQRLTQLGGLAGVNTGIITSAFATGPVGTSGVAYLEVGGLVAQNHGLIGNSAALGAVNAGDNSVAGGLTASNSPSSNNGCNGCVLAVGHDNSATVLSSFATGNVTVGAVSFAGGLSGTGDGIFSGTIATGNVSGGANSVLGGLVGAIGVGQGASSVSQSFASGKVESTGPNSVVGGLVGANGGSIIASGALRPVSGTSQSYLGGLVGINIGLIRDSSASGLVTGSGAQNFTGGLVGLNFGLVDPSTSSGAVTSGANSIVGGLIGANGAFGPFSNIPNGVVIPGSFPVGTVSADSLATGPATGGAGSLVGPQFGENYPTAGLPSYPAVVNACNNGLCVILATGVLTDPNPPSIPPSTPPISPPESLPLPPPPPSIAQTQIIQNLVQNIALASTTLGEVVNTQPLNQPAPGTPPAGVGQPPAPPAGLPPQFGPRFFTPPPLGEVHVVQSEVVLQVPNNIPPNQLQSIMAAMGLSILGSQNMSLIGVTSYRVHIDNGASIASVIQKLAAYQVLAGAQANYTYWTTQDQPREPDLAGLTQGEGDAAQYAIGKLGLIDVHRQLKGSNISIAVIDSQIDVHHPDLDGDIVEQFDAVGQPDKPHSHGTGMAGAIASHRKLMGVAPAARIYAIHAFSSGAASSESTTFNILKGLEWAASKGVRVINMSFAGPRDPSLERALKAAHDKGIVLIAAAGNAGPKSPPLYPGADPNVIAVTATDVNDKLFTGANRGRYIAVAAPGVDILVPAPDNAYQLTTGTSVASAEVAGLVALLLERNPALGPEDIRKILTSSARRLGGKDRDDDFGSGLVDPGKAIQTAGDLKPLEVTGPAPAPASPPPARAPASSRAPVLSSSPRPAR